MFHVLECRVLTIYLKFFFMGGEGNSNLLQYSCLENPVDRGDW